MLVRGSKPRQGPQTRVLRHLDDVPCAHHNAMRQTRAINKRFLHEGGSVGDPNNHLDSELRKATAENGVEAWSVSPSKCAQEAAKSAKSHLHEKEPGRAWLKKVPTPCAKDCRPEIEILPKPGAEDASHCVSQPRLESCAGWSKPEEWMSLPKHHQCWHRSCSAPKRQPHGSHVVDVSLRSAKSASVSNHWHANQDTNGRAKTCS